MKTYNHELTLETIKNTLIRYKGVKLAKVDFLWNGEHRQVLAVINPRGVVTESTYNFNNLTNYLNLHRDSVDCLPLNSNYFIGRGLTLQKISLAFNEDYSDFRYTIFETPEDCLDYLTTELFVEELKK
jgi:two-component SAPR family response regulator